jgi:hypothetical protein
MLQGKNGQPIIMNTQGIVENKDKQCLQVKHNHSRDTFTVVRNNVMLFCRLLDAYE